MQQLEIYSDGASKGNPGPAGIGVVILSEGKVIRNESVFIGNATNNFAEYSALIHGLKVARNLGAKVLSLNVDSELVSKQLNRQYKVKSANISQLYHQAEQLISEFESVSICHVRREYNQIADKLANEAVSNAIKGKRV